MSLYQQNCNFIGVVFTKSNTILKEATKYNLTVFHTVERNEFDIPVVRSMLEVMRKNIHADYYGYMNSDILLNPRVFQLLRNSSDLFIDSHSELVGRVLEVPFPFSLSDFSTIKRVEQVFSSNYTNTRIRNPLSADVFIFPKNFPFEIIPPVVIGRFKVDTILMRIPQLVKGCRIDFSEYGNISVNIIIVIALSIHQGRDGFQSHGMKRLVNENRLYNNKYFIAPSKNACLMRVTKQGLLI